MSFFQKIGNAIVRFMYGRNGMDYLNRTLFWGYIGVFLAQILFNILRLGVPALICEALLWPLMLLILFRMFSKNLPKRRGGSGTGGAASRAAMPAPRPATPTRTTSISPARPAARCAGCRWARGRSSLPAPNAALRSTPKHEKCPRMPGIRGSFYASSDSFSSSDGA